MPISGSKIASISIAVWSACAWAQLPPVPVPIENPITEAKRVLGKILFWDEQLSSNNTVACGTCHRPAAGGADPRAGRHPGIDAGTIDDVQGSPGIVKLDQHGRPVEHPVFGREPQVTPRLSPSNFGALWANEVFWDGRSGGRFIDPLTGEVAIADGGALENQALTALSSDAEMTKEGRAWSELALKLARAAPLGLASNLPRDISTTLQDFEDYPSLFEAAFGDNSITPVRIAFAIASYERTLVADQTPWDRYQAGDAEALNETELLGWQAMQDFHCTKCHEPPLFTNNDFFNIGLRRSQYDLGRQNVTGDAEDAGEMKVPSLRNVSLRSRFMHTGEFASLGAAVSFYRTGPALAHRDDIPGGGIYAFNMGTLTESDIRVFLGNALTDNRVRGEEFPFDRPMLRSERHSDDAIPPDMPQNFTAEIERREIRLHWSAAHDDTGLVDYVLERDEAVIALLTRTTFTDRIAMNESKVTYRLVARDAAQNESPAATLELTLSAP